MDGRDPIGEEAHDLREESGNAALVVDEDVDEQSEENYLLDVHKACK